MKTFAWNPLHFVLLALVAAGMQGWSLPRAGWAEEGTAEDKAPADLLEEAKAVLAAHLASMKSELEPDEYYDGVEEKIVEVEANPPLKTWSKAPEGGPICVTPFSPGIEDLEGESEWRKRLLAAAVELFAVYGVDVSSGKQIVLGSGENEVEFAVDGYDPERKIGFEVLDPNLSALAESEDEESSALARARLLEHRELQEMSAQISSGKINVFIGSYPERTPMANLDPAERFRCFMESVVEYLAWLKAEGKI